MNRVNVAQLKEALQKTLGVVSALNPTLAVADAGAQALGAVWASLAEYNQLLKQIVAETHETAPEVAREVSAFYQQKAAELELQFSDRVR